MVPVVQKAARVDLAEKAARTAQRVAVVAGQKVVVKTVAVHLLTDRLCPIEMLVNHDAWSVHIR